MNKFNPLLSLSEISLSLKKPIFLFTLFTICFFGLVSYAFADSEPRYTFGCWQEDPPPVPPLIPAGRFVLIESITVDEGDTTVWPIQVEHEPHIYSPNSFSAQEITIVLEFDPSLVTIEGTQRYESVDGLSSLVGSSVDNVNGTINIKFYRRNSVIRTEFLTVTAKSLSTASENMIITGTAISDEWDCGYPYGAYPIDIAPGTISITSSDSSTSGFSCDQVTEIPLAECESLVALYNDTNGANWDFTINPDISGGDWLQSMTPCSWYGVTCVGGGVTEISLNGSCCSSTGKFGLVGHLPATIRDLSNLTKLSLVGNQLESIPEDIGMLDNLIHLSLGANQLTDIPAGIGGLSSLQHLDLSINQLRTLPDEIGMLSSLTNLDLDVNNLIVLPDGIGMLTNLTWLDLDGNQLTTFPSTIEGLDNLIYLFASNSQMTLLPSTIGGLDSLKYMYLANNQLMNIPSEISGLGDTLEDIDLNNNQLSYLEGIVNLASLVDLRLSNNPLEAWPSNIVNLTLNELSLDNLCIPNGSTVQAWIDNIPNVEGETTGILCSQSPVITPSPTNIPTVPTATNTPSPTATPPTVSTPCNADQLCLYDGAGYTGNMLVIDMTDPQNQDGNIYIDPIYPGNTVDFVNQLTSIINNSVYEVTLGSESAGSYVVDANDQVDLTGQLLDNQVYYLNIQPMAFTCDDVTEIPQLECEALVALYDSTNEDGDNWTYNGSTSGHWFESTTPCDWAGIGCCEPKNSSQFGCCEPTDSSQIGNTNNEVNCCEFYSESPEKDADTCIIALYLLGFGLKGDIPTDIENLSQLRFLNLSVNQLESIPNTINNLIYLIQLQVFSNHLTSLPDIKDLQDLISLRFGFNPITDWRPSLTSLTSLWREGSEVQDTLHIYELCESSDTDIKNWLDNLDGNSGIRVTGRTGIPCDEVEVAGRVWVDGDNTGIDTPLAGVEIQVVGVYDPVVGDDFIVVSQTITTTSTGEYSLNILPFATYTLTINEATVNAEGNLVLDPDGSLDGETTVVLSPSSHSRTDLNFAYGTVLDCSGTGTTIDPLTLTQSVSNGVTIMVDSMAEHGCSYDVTIYEVDQCKSTSFTDAELANPIQNVNGELTFPLSLNANGALKGATAYVVKLNVANPNNLSASEQACIVTGCPDDHICLYKENSEGVGLAIDSVDYNGTSISPSPIFEGELIIIDNVNFDSRTDDAYDRTHTNTILGTNHPFPERNIITFNPLFSIINNSIYTVEYGFQQDEPTDPNYVMKNTVPPMSEETGPIFAGNVTYLSLGEEWCTEIYRGTGRTQYDHNRTPVYLETRSNDELFELLKTAHTTCVKYIVKILDERDSNVFNPTLEDDSLANWMDSQMDGKNPNNENYFLFRNIVFILETYYIEDACNYDDDAYRTALSAMFLEHIQSVANLDLADATLNPVSNFRVLANEARLLRNILYRSNPPMNNTAQADPIILEMVNFITQNNAQVTNVADYAITLRGYVQGFADKENDILCENHSGVTLSNEDIRLLEELASFLQAKLAEVEMGDITFDNNEYLTISAYLDGVDGGRSFFTIEKTRALFNLARLLDILEECLVGISETSHEAGEGEDWFEHLQHEYEDIYLQPTDGDNPNNKCTRIMFADVYLQLGWNSPRTPVTVCGWFRAIHEGYLAMRDLNALPTVVHPNESNNNVLAVIFPNRTIYRAYVGYFDVGSGMSGGVYYEGGGLDVIGRNTLPSGTPPIQNVFYTYDRTSKGYTYSLEHLAKHEFSHFLIGRYNLPGAPSDYPDYTSVYNEGLAEYLAFHHDDATLSNPTPNDVYRHRVCAAGYSEDTTGTLSFRSEYYTLARLFDQNDSIADAAEYPARYSFAYYLYNNELTTFRTIYNDLTNEINANPYNVSPLSPYWMMIESRWQEMLDDWCRDWEPTELQQNEDPINMLFDNDTSSYYLQTVAPQGGLFTIYIEHPGSIPFDVVIHDQFGNIVMSDSFAPSLLRRASVLAQEYSVIIDAMAGEQYSVDVILQNSVTETESVEMSIRAESILDTVPLAINLNAVQIPYQQTGYLVMVIVVATMITGIVITKSRERLIR